MRAAFTMAAFAAGALAMPYKRELVTDVDMVYVTEVVTVTAGQPQPTPEPKPVAAPEEKHFGGDWNFQHRPHAQPPWRQETDEAPAVYTTAWATTIETTYQAPAYTEAPQPTWTPEPTSTPEPEPVPATSTYVQPSTYEAPPPAPTTTEVAAEPSAPASSAPAPSSAPSYGSSYQETVINQHNVHRANHSAPDLKWSDKLASIAAEIASSCKYAHNTEVGTSDDFHYGQNIAAGVESEKIGEVITNMFYNGEEPLFSALYGNPLGAGVDLMSVGFEGWGHFTQVVWKDTDSVGCATQHCPGGLFGGDGSPMSDLIQPYFTVCNYANPGNMEGGYAENVGRPLGKPTVQG